MSGKVGDTKSATGGTAVTSTPVPEGKKPGLGHGIAAEAKKIWHIVGPHKTPAPQPAIVDGPAKVGATESFSKTGISVQQLRSVMPSLSESKAAAMLPHLNRAMAEANINTPKRAAAFLGQLAQESGELKYFQELATGRAYEGRRDLGNTEPGDGERFKGRGPIQLTGRNNYIAAGKALGLDLVNHPELAAQPDIGFKVAGWFWQTRGLNQLADKGDFKEITRRVNGGFNGLAQRESYYARANAALGGGLTGGPLSTGDTPVPRMDPPSHDYGMRKGSTYGTAPAEAQRMVRAYAEQSSFSPEELYMLLLMAMSSMSDDEVANDPGFADFAKSAGVDWQPGQPVPQDLKAEFLTGKLTSLAKTNPEGLRGALQALKTPPRSP